MQPVIKKELRLKTLKVSMQTQKKLLLRYRGFLSCYALEDVKSILSLRIFTVEKNPQRLF